MSGDDTNDVPLLECFERILAARLAPHDPQGGYEYREASIEAADACDGGSSSVEWFELSPEELREIIVALSAAHTRASVVPHPSDFNAGVEACARAIEQHSGQRPLHAADFRALKSDAPKMARREDILAAIGAINAGHIERAEAILNEALLASAPKVSPPPCHSCHRDFAGERRWRMTTSATGPRPLPEFCDKCAPRIGLGVLDEVSGERISE